MYSNIAELISLLLLIGYLYVKIKDKIALWLLGYAFYLICCLFLFRLIYPNVPFISPTIEYMGFLFITGLPFLVIIVLIGVETEKRRSGAIAIEEQTKDMKKIFNISKGNIIFWAIIVLINLIAFLLENNSK